MQHSGSFQGAFREHSGNIQGTFKEHSGNIQGSFSSGGGLEYNGPTFCGEKDFGKTLLAKEIAPYCVFFVSCSKQQAAAHACVSKGEATSAILRNFGEHVGTKGIFILISKNF